jgi:hypothetical protein
LRKRGAASNFNDTSSKLKEYIWDLSILVKTRRDSNGVRHFGSKYIDGELRGVEGRVALSRVKVKLISHLQRYGTGMMSVLGVRESPANEWRNNPTVEESSGIGGIEV